MAGRRGEVVGDDQSRLDFAVPRYGDLPDFSVISLQADSAVANSKRPEAVRRLHADGIPLVLRSGSRLVHPLLPLSADDEEEDALAVQTGEVLVCRELAVEDQAGRVRPSCLAPEVQELEHGVFLAVVPDRGVAVCGDVAVRECDRAAWMLLSASWRLPDQ